ncbi:hypothetical protein C8J56DRAFT_1049627 [Mycena floridula]|nr:hypothetical protein C8J56DRAFT_1049627 [Mycena floridula]
MSFTTPVDDIGTSNQAYESEPDNPLNVRLKSSTAVHYNSPAETLSDLQTSDSDLTHSPNFRNHPVKISSDIDDEATTRRRQRSRSRGGYHDRTPEMMPLPPNKGAPKKFRGDYAYVRKFLKQYVQLCRAYNVTSEQEKCEKLLDYVSSRVGKFIESNSNYINKDWDELEKDLLHYYDAERVDTRYALKDLVLLTDKWAKKDMSDLATYKRYSIEFHTIAGWLVMKDMLTIRHRDGHFFRGIKRGLREKLEERYINQNRGATLKDPIPIAAIDKMIENQFNRHSYCDELEDTLTSRKHQSKSQRDRDYDYDSDSDDSGSEQAPGDESDTEDSDEEDSNDGRQNKCHIREGKKKSTKRKHSKSRRDEDNNSDREDPSKSSHHSKKPHKTYDESEDEEDDSKHNKSSRHSRKNHKTYDSARDEDDRKVERLVKERLAEEDQKATRGRTRSDSVPDTASSKSKSNKRVPDAAELDALIDKMRTMEITDARYQGLYMQAYLINPVIARIVKQPPNPNETMQVAQQTPAVQSVQTGPPLTGPNLIPVAGNGYQGAPATMQSFQEEGCFGCGLGGHMLRNCQRVNDLVMEGLVTRDDLGRLRYLNGNLVRRINGLYLADSVVRTINSQAPALSTFLAEIDEASNRTMQDLAQEGKETYNAETGELEFKWRPKPEVYDNSEPPLHDKIAQWMGKKSWVTECWDDLVETAMARTQITGEAPALSENGYADTTKIEPPLIFWDERHYFGIYQDDEIYLIPEGRFGLVIAEEFHEEMMNQSIKFLTGVDVMIDSQSVKMDFISQQTKGGFKLGRLWGDKLEEILGKEIAMADQRLGHLLRVNRLAERNATIILSSKPGTDHVLSAKVIDTQKNNDNADFIRDKKENYMEPRLVPRQLPSDPESVQPTTVTEILEEIDDIDQFEGLTLNEPKGEPEKVPQTIAPHLVKVDCKISKESRFTAIVVPSMSRNMLRRSAACQLTGWEPGEINNLEEGIEFNGVQIGFCGRTYELNMTLVDDMENDVAIGKDWMDVGVESLNNLKNLLVQSKTKQVVLKIKAQLTKEEAVMAILQPEDTFSTISQALVKRTRGEERLCSAEFSTTGEYIQIRTTYQDETVTIAALIVPTSKGECEVTLGSNWINQTRRCVIRTVTVTKPEVSIAATSLADGCTVPSPVFMIDLPRLVNQSTSKVDGGLRMDKEKQSEIAKQHNGNFEGVADGIWAAPGILSTSWAVSVTIRQQEIERLTAEINEWAQMQGFKLAGLHTQSLPGTIKSPSEDMNKILSNATKDPDLTAELRQKIRRLTGVNLFDSESTPDAQFSDKDSDPESYFKGLEQIAPQIIPAAPIASHHFLKVLKDLKKYWLQLAQFEALIRAQGYQLIIAKHEGKLNPGFQMEETTKSAETKEIHSRESIVEVPTKTDTLPIKFQAHPSTKLEATEGPEAIQIRPNKEIGGSGLAHRVSSEDLGPCVLWPRGFKLGLRKMTASEQAQAESNLETRR